MPALGSRDLRGPHPPLPHIRDLWLLCDTGRDGVRVCVSHGNVSCPPRGTVRRSLEPQRRGLGALLCCPPGSLSGPPGETCDPVHVLDCRAQLGGRPEEAVLHGGRERALRPAGGHPGSPRRLQPAEGESSRPDACTPRWGLQHAGTPERPCPGAALPPRPVLSTSQVPRVPRVATGLRSPQRGHPAPDPTSEAHVSLS